MDQWLGSMGYNILLKGVYIAVIPRTRMTHILEDSTHKIEGQPPKKGVSWVLGIYIYIGVITH